MLVSKDNPNSVMITSLSTLSSPCSSTSSFEETKCSTHSKLVEDKSIFYEASLAQAECDDDLEEDTERSMKSFSNFELFDENSQKEDTFKLDHTEKTNEFFQKNSDRKENKRLALSNDAKEYWATIDFYNNSKIAFNKRLKSVRLKREKLNFEMKERNIVQSVEPLIKNTTQESQINQDLCSCVKCSIIIHEALIQGIQNVHEILCKKCHSNSNSCKCILSDENKISEEDKIVGREKRLDSFNLKKISNKKESNHLEEKLFNIKNELINLSETSLDVFQLLLQLSDTVLDLNNQLSSSTNVNQLFLLNSSSNLNQSIFSTLENNSLSNKAFENREFVKKELCKDTKSNKIENFLQKNFYCTQSEINSTNKELNNSITSIINKINNRSNNQKIEHLKKIFSSKSRSNSPVVNKDQSSNLIENIYDKTSVTQFVDSLLNSKPVEDLSRASSGFYSATSLLTMINQEDITNASLTDMSLSYPIKQTPNIKLSSTINNIIARQTKNPSSSNLDLSESKSLRHSTLSTSSSNTDSSIDHTKFMTIQSPKSKENHQTNPAVSNGSSRKNSGSNNTLSSNSSSTSPVPSILLSGVRKPSFKFENNTILNKVQNMNIKNKYSSPQNLNGICEGSLDKRSSFNRHKEYDSEQCSVSRQQSVKLQSLAQTPVRSESSLDSGINLSSENEESKIISNIK